MNQNKPRFVGESRRVKLGELITKAKVERCGNRNFPVYSMTMHDGIVEQAGRFKKSIASKDTSSYKVVTKNQLVVGFPIDEGVIYVQNHDEPGIMSPAYNVWDFDQSRLDPAYLELALHSPQSMAYYADKMRGTTARRRSLTADGLRSLSIPLPSMDKQLEIVAALKGIKAQISYAQDQASKLDQLVKSRFVEVFGTADRPPAEFPVSTIGEVCDSVIRGPFGSALKKSFFVPKGDDTYKVYEQKHAIQRRSDIGTYYITSNKYEELKRFECFPGDILMSCSGTMGKLYQLPQDCERGVMNQALCKFKLGNSILPDYFFGFMEQVVDDLGAKGSGIKNVSSVKFIKAIKIPLPPIEVQLDFAAFVSQVDKPRFAIQQQIEKLEMLKASLMQEYFG